MSCFKCIGLWHDTNIGTMGFGSDIRTKSSHETLVTLQDAELRLLENMKRCLALRIKCDREYAIGLNSVCIHTQKIDKSEVLGSSMITRTWSVIAEETGALSRLMKQNADYLASNTTEALNNFILEKQALKKLYMDEHTRMHGELQRLQDGVTKTKNNYEKYIDLWKIAKKKYEEQLTKGKVSKKLDEARERYYKIAKELHRLHNDYVMLIHEGIEYEQQLKTVLLPGLHEYHYTILQDSVDTWKNILMEFAQYTDFSSETFQSIHIKIQKSIESLSGEDEYKDLGNKLQSHVFFPTDFKFDIKLLEDYNGTLQMDKIAVDDLTLEILNKKLEDLRAKLLQCQTELKEKHLELEQYESETSILRSTGETKLLLVKKRAMDIIKKSINELNCRQKRLQGMCHLLDSPLSVIGSTGPTPGIELDEKVICDNPSKIKESSTSSLNIIGKKSARLFVEKLKQPFHSFHKKSSSNEVLSGQKINYNSINVPTTSNEINLDSDYLKGLQDEEWFHGVLPREEVIRLLVNEGDFLVRETLRNEERQIVLSVCWQGHKHFIIQNTSDGKYRFEGPAFSTVQELIMYQYHSNTPVTNRSGAMIKNPILREQWQLNNEDVELVEKIGRGNFGDVYRGLIRKTKVPVAIKTCRINLPDEQKKRFLQEGRILRQYDHPNIVKLIGICVQKQPIMIVMELVPGGSLLNYLRKNGPKISLSEQLRMCLDSALGMEYLESKNCIHRDLAARNCLVGKNNMVKISDFGMSREEEEYTVSDGMKQIPIKWTAPEALNYGRYTSLCDVWSYGVLLWEIFSFGSTPYSGMTNNKARELIDSGYRLPAPENTPECIYELMLRCWEYDQDRRPHFQEIRETLQSISVSYK